jgi:hypothetical protein
MFDEYERALIESMRPSCIAMPRAEYWDLAIMLPYQAPRIADLIDNNTALTNGLQGNIPDLLAVHPATAAPWWRIQMICTLANR